MSKAEPRRTGTFLMPGGGSGSPTLPTELTAKSTVESPRTLTSSAHVPNDSAAAMQSAPSQLSSLCIHLQY